MKQDLRTIYYSQKENRLIKVSEVLSRWRFAIVVHNQCMLCCHILNEQLFITRTLPHIIQTLNGLKYPQCLFFKIYAFKMKISIQETWSISPYESEKFQPYREGCCKQRDSMKAQYVTTTLYYSIAISRIYKSCWRKPVFFARKSQPDRDITYILLHRLVINLLSASKLCQQNFEKNLKININFIMLRSKTRGQTLRVDPYETAHYEPGHLYLQCLQILLVLYWFKIKEA